MKYYQIYRRFDLPTLSSNGRIRAVHLKNQMAQIRYFRQAENFFFGLFSFGVISLDSEVGVKYYGILPSQLMSSELMLRSYRVDKNTDVSLEDRPHQEVDLIRRPISSKSQDHQKANLIERLRSSSSGHVAVDHYLS